jgi:hypothetical protein
LRFIGLGDVGIFNRDALLRLDLNDKLIGNSTPILLLDWQAIGLANSESSSEVAVAV